MKICTFLLAAIGIVQVGAEWIDSIPSYINISEAANVGYVTGFLQYRSSSPQDAIVYSSNSSYFDVDSTTGSISLRQKLIYRYTKSIDVIFTATVNRNTQVTRTVTVNVVPINHAPMFDYPSYAISIKDNIAINTTIYDSIFVIDTDDGANGTVQVYCNITVGTACQYFQINPQLDSSFPGRTKVTVSLLKALESGRLQYDLPLVTTDFGTPQLMSSAKLSVLVEASQDSRPLFINTPIIFNVQEQEQDKGRNFFVVQVREQRQFSTDNGMTFTLVGDTKNWFTLGGPTSSNGVYSVPIRVNGNINMKDNAMNTRYSFEFNVTLTFKDQLTQVSSLAAVTANIVDVNDNTPTFSASSYSANVSEGLGNGATVAGISMIVSDSDLGDNAYFQLTLISNPSPSPGIFGLVPIEGQSTAAVAVVVLKPEYLRYDSPLLRYYTLTITARETRTVERRSSTATVQLQVISPLNHPPYFPNVLNPIVVSDNLLPGTIISTYIRAVDDDIGSFGNIIYSIGNDYNASYYFNINPTSGYLTLRNPLNYTIQPSYIFPVIATDSGGLSTSMTIRIDVTDSKNAGPQFSPSSYTTTVIENQIQLIPPVVVMAQLVPMQHDRVIWYSFQNPFPLTGTFAMNTTTGELKMLKGVDFNDTPNKQGYFDLKVEAFVVGYPDIPRTPVTIRVYVTDTNNHAPVFVPQGQILKTTIKQNAPSNKEIFYLNATDDDVGPNGKVIYQIQDGSFDNFVISPFEGILKLAPRPNLIPGTTYNITVAAIDGGQPPLTGTTMVYVTVTDVVFRPPIFQFPDYTFYVNEGSNIGQLVGTVLATSPDLRPIINYMFLQDTWKAMDKDRNPLLQSNNIVKNWFAINSNTGETTVQGNVVYSTAPIVNVYVQANVTNKDPSVVGQLATNVSVTFLIVPKMGIQDSVTFSPTTDVFYFSIYERQPINTLIYQFKAFYLQTSSPVTSFKFYNSTDSRDYFMLEETTGILRTKRDIIYIQLDYKTVFNYTIVAQAPAPSTAQAVAKVVINVLPLNGDNPIFSNSTYLFYVRSDSAVGTAIGSISAKPPREGMGPITYALQTPNSLFSLDENTGLIRLLKNLNDQNTAQLNYPFSVKATIGATAFYSFSLVTVVVIPVRVRPPQFIGSPYTFVTVSNQTTIGQVQAFDPFPFNATKIKYAIVGAVDTFKIDPDSGTIMAVLVPLTGNLYKLNVSATDTSLNPMTSYTNVDVIVPSVTGQPVIVQPESNKTAVYYDGQSDALILQVVAIPNNSVSYALDNSRLSAADKSKFYINSLGEVRVKGVLSGDKWSSYPLILVVSNSFGVSTKEITVNGYSKSPPTFLCKSNPVLIKVTDFTLPDINLDSDIQVIPGTPCSYDMPGKQFYYKIIDSDNSNLISLSPTGQFTSVKTLEAYKNDGYTVKVLIASSANDTNQAVLRQGTTVYATLKFVGANSRVPDFNSNNSYCPGSGASTIKGILELTPFNSFVAHLFAGDCDMPGFRNNIYSISGVQYFSSTINKLEGETQSQDDNIKAFRIDPVTGQVYTGLTDYRNFFRGWFDLNIKAATMMNNVERASIASLKVYIVRETQMYKAVFNQGVVQAQNNSARIVSEINSKLLQGHQIVPDLVTSYVSSTGARDLTKASMCYFILEFDSTLNPPQYKVVSDNTVLVQLIGQNTSQYGITNFYDTCYSRSGNTTMWWSEKWFLWFILIALSILVFFVALILSCCVCFYWPMNLKGISKARPYVVLDDPPMSTAGSVFDYGQ